MLVMLEVTIVCLLACMLVFDSHQFLLLSRLTSLAQNSCLMIMPCVGPETILPNIIFTKKHFLDLNFQKPLSWDLYYKCSY